MVYHLVLWEYLKTGLWIQTVINILSLKQYSLLRTAIKLHILTI